MKKGAAETLLERQTLHGEFTDNARIMQYLKNGLHASPNWKDLTNIQKEALEMICTKIGRIVTGNPHESDHWLDIEGYSRLVRERL